MLPDGPWSSVGLSELCVLVVGLGDASYDPDTMSVDWRSDWPSGWLYVMLAFECLPWGLLVSWPGCCSHRALPKQVVLGSDVGLQSPRGVRGAQPSPLPLPLL